MSELVAIALSSRTQTQDGLLRGFLAGAQECQGRTLECRMRRES